MSTKYNLITGNIKTPSLIIKEERPDTLLSGAVRIYYVSPSFDGFFLTIHPVSLLSGSSTTVSIVTIKHGS
jgi:hypothetical protein